MIKIGYRLLPDGSDVIVEVRIDIDFTITHEDAERTAQEVVARLAAQLTGRPLAEILERYQASLWLGEMPRPQEGLR